jgi:hypothetical protein
MNISRVLSTYWLGYSYTLKGNKYSGLIWEDERPQPTEEEIQAKIAELEAAEPMRLLRIERNRILQQSDWRDLPSYPGTDQELFSTYYRSCHCSKRHCKW